MAYNDKTTLMMFSGGLDSFLSTCRMIMDGYNVDMISYDNGAMYNLDQVVRHIKSVKAFKDLNKTE